MKAHIITAAIVVLGLPIYTADAAILTEWGTSSITASAECADFCNPLFDARYFPTLAWGPSSGGAGINTSSVNLSNDLGNAFAEATIFNGPLALPLLRASADSESGGWVQGIAIGVQGYTALTTGTLGLSVSLTGNVTNPDDDPATGLSAIVSLHTVDVSDGSDFLFSNAAAAIYASLNKVEIESTAHGAVNETGGLSIDVVAGDQFYLVAFLGASAGGDGAIAESLSTLTINSDPLVTSETLELEFAGSPVPLPASIVLLGPALFVLGFRCRRRPDY